MVEPDYPRAELDNGVIRVAVYLPDGDRGYYRGCRFDWSGIIERVVFGGHRFFAPFHAIHDPHLHDAVSGPAEEFGMTEPMGFAEAAIGESFVKVGVGLLMKGEDNNYRFDSDYKMIRSGQWEIRHEPGRIEFLQELRGDRGWAYRYRKVIELDPGLPELVIKHRLENTGEKVIDIDHYNHNFTIIDDVPYGPDYRIELAIETDSPVSINGRAWFRGNAIEIDKPLGENYLWAEIFKGDGRTDYNAAVVRNARTGAAVEFKGDAAVTRMVFWAVERAACPEPFIRLHLTPGQAREWSTRYRFSIDKETAS